MRYFFDNNLSPKLVAILKILDVDALHLKDEFPTDTEDVVWLPHAGTEGWIVITVDNRIRRNPAERLALRQNRVTALFLRETFLKKRIWEQAEWIIRHWPIIEKEAAKLSVGTCATVHENGRLEILK